MYCGYGGLGGPIEAVIDDLRCGLKMNAAGAVLDFCVLRGGPSVSPKHMIIAWTLLKDAGRL